jgi:hypothetical protein
MKKINALIGLIILLVLSAPEDLLGEFICTAEISYKWARNEKKSVEAKVTPSPTPQAENPADSSLSVFWTNIEKSAATEEEAKKFVNKVSLQEKASAEKDCVSQHENLSGCIASKFESLSATMSRLSFSARKSMEEAIHQDCSSQQGKCLGAAISEIKCSEKVDPKAAEAEASKDGKDKKDAKKK